MADISYHIAEIAKCVSRNAGMDTYDQNLIKDNLKNITDITKENEDFEQSTVEKRFFVQIEKANQEQQTITGVVLQPEVVDAQGDIYSSEVIRDSAYKFLSNYNKYTKLGVQHSTFPKGKMNLVESWIAPHNLVIGAKTIKQGSWIMTVKILDKELWQRVKDGKITGFSIGGKAKVKYLNE